jgi:hypothetical protein
VSAAHAGDNENDRRHAPRRSTDYELRLAVSDEKPAQTARIINISASGLLAVVPDPMGEWRGQRAVLSLTWDDTGHRHVLGRVARVDRGADHRTYVGVEFDTVLWDF